MQAGDAAGESVAHVEERGVGVGESSGLREKLGGVAGSDGAD